MPPPSPRHVASPAAVGALVALPLALYLGLSAVTAQPDPDPYWVGAAGRWMLVHGQVPRENLFSFTAPEHPWVMHAWALGPFYARALASWGPVALVGIAVFVAWLARALLALSILRDAVDLRAAVGMLLLSTFGLGSYLSVARPSAVGLALLAAMALLAYRSRFGVGAAAAAVGLELVWSSAHGSFPLGVALLLAGAVDARADRRWRVVAVIASAAVTAIGPYGLELHAHVLGYALGTRPGAAWVRAHIVEFRPLWEEGHAFLSGTDLVGLGVVLGLAVTALARGRRRAAAALVLTLLGLGVFTVRYFPLAATAGCALLTPLGPSGGVREITGERRVVGAVYLAVPLAVALAVHVAARVGAPADRWESALLGGADVPALLASVPDGARLYAPLYPSSRVLWEAAPREVRVFFDLRNDCYPPAIADAALRLESPSTAPASARRILARHGVDHVLAPRASALARALEGWDAARPIARRGSYSLWAVDGGALTPSRGPSRRSR